MKMLHLAGYDNFALGRACARRLPLALCGRVVTVISTMVSGRCRILQERGTAWVENFSRHRGGEERLWEAWWCGSPRTVLVFSDGIVSLCAGQGWFSVLRLEAHSTYTPGRKVGGCVVDGKESQTECAVAL